MAPSLNDIQIYACLVFHVVPELPNGSALLNLKAAWKQTLLAALENKGDFLS